MLLRRNFTSTFHINLNFPLKTKNTSQAIMKSDYILHNYY